MKKSEVFEFLDKYKTLLLALLLLFVTVVVVQVNYNKNHMHDYTVDEYFTITTIHPKLTPDKTIHRALNGPRMFTYLFYPGALVGMINHMGGNIYEDGWKYPGHNYFVNNYRTSASGLKYNMEDPNFRYFHYYLKLQAIVFMFLSFIPIVFWLWKNNYRVAMFMVATLIGINFLALEERSLFYIEPMLITMMNLLIWLYFFIAGKKKISWFWIVFSAFLFALTISLKFSSLFFIGLIMVLLVSKFRSLEKRLTASLLLIVLSLLFFCLINWNIFYSKDVFNAVVHDYFSNFWQYATGNKGQVVADFKTYNLKKMVMEVFYSLGGLVFILPVLLFFGLKWSPKKSFWTWAAFIGIIFLSISLIAKQQVYIDRNILPFLTALVLITGVMIDRIIYRIKEDKNFKGKLKPVYLYVLLGLFVFLPMWVHSKNYFGTILPSAKANIAKEIQEMEGKENKRLVTIDFPDADVGEGFRSRKEVPSAIPTNGKNFKNFLQTSVLNFETEDVVAIAEVKNNKQLTTYVLPGIFNANKQYGKYFVFYNDPQKNPEFQRISTMFNQANTKSLLRDSVAVRSDLILREIKIDQEHTLFFKFDFLAAKTKDWKGCRFYFHGKAYDEDVARLPAERVQYGFEGWDFTIDETNSLRYGNSMYVIHQFEPSLQRYKEFAFGIFRGCTTSDEFVVNDVTLSE